MYTFSYDKYINQINPIYSFIETYHKSARTVTSMLDKFPETESKKDRQAMTDGDRERDTQRKRERERRSPNMYS